MARPGIMLYFDILEPIRVLPDAEKGRLLVAMLEYGQSGISPTFDGMLALAWGFVKPKIDKDEESYEISCVQREYAAFCKLRKKMGLPKISFDEWKEMGENERQRMISDDNGPLRAVNSVELRYPTTKTTTTTMTTTSTAAEANATAKDEGAAAATDERKVIKSVGGTLGKGVVFLSDEQFDDLLEKMGIDVLNRYIDRLSNFIIRENASVYNHYETLLDWWRKDSRVQ